MLVCGIALGLNESFQGLGSSVGGDLLIIERGHEQVVDPVVIEPFEFAFKNGPLCFHARQVGDQSGALARCQNERVYAAVPGGDVCGPSMFFFRSAHSSAVRCQI